MHDHATEVRESPISGRGTFALRGITAGETIYEWDMSNMLTDEQYARLSEDEKQYVLRYKGGWLYMLEPMRYINHSCEPNAKPIGSADVAARDIKEGEEVTEDYRPYMPAGERMECHCGAPSCKGYIIGTAA